MKKIWTATILALFAQLLFFAEPVFSQGVRYNTPGSAKPPVDEDDGPDDPDTPIGNIKSVIDALRTLNAVVEEQNKKIETVEKYLESQTCPESKDGEILTSLSLLSQTQGEALKTVEGKIEELRKANANAATKEEVAQIIATIIADIKDASDRNGNNVVSELKTALEATNRTVETSVETMKSNYAATNETLKSAIEEIPVPETPTPFGTFWGGFKNVASATITFFVAFQGVLGSFRFFRNRKENRRREEEAKEKEREEKIRREFQASLTQQNPQTVVRKEMEQKQTDNEIKFL